MKLQAHDTGIGKWMRFSDSTLEISREAIKTVMAAIDAGHLDAIRHFAEHGTLPVEAPVWPGCDVNRCGTDWKVTRQGCLLATIGEYPGGWVAMLYPAYAFRPTSFDGCWRGETPQAAVDAARAGIRAHWGLST